jgi:hypothetical protein
MNHSFCYPSQSEIKMFAGDARSFWRRQEPGSLALLGMTEIVFRRLSGFDQLLARIPAYYC